MRVRVVSPGLTSLSFCTSYLIFFFSILLSLPVSRGRSSSSTLTHATTSETTHKSVHYKHACILHACLHAVGSCDGADQSPTISWSFWNAFLSSRSFLLSWSTVSTPSALSVSCSECIPEGCMKITIQHSDHSTNWSIILHCNVGRVYYTSRRACLVCISYLARIYIYSL